LQISNQSPLHCATATLAYLNRTDKFVERKYALLNYKRKHGEGKKDYIEFTKPGFQSSFHTSQ
jgi:hypothetical protein